MQMICDFPKWREFLIYDGFKYHVNVNDGLNCFAEESIKVGKEEDGTRDLNPVYNKSQANQDKA